VLGVLGHKSFIARLTKKPITSPTSCTSGWRRRVCRFDIIFLQRGYRKIREGYK